MNGNLQIENIEKFIDIVKWRKENPEEWKEFLRGFKEILIDSPLKVKNKILLIRDCIERNSKRDNFIFVGDSEVDICSGKELDMLTVAVTYGIRSKEFLEKLEPDFYLDNLSEIVEILENMGDIYDSLP